MSVKEKVSSFALDKAIDYISGDPETNIPKLLGLLDSLGIKSFEPASRGIHAVLGDTDGVWYKFIMDLWRDIDNDVLKSVVQNFGLKAAVFGNQKQDALSEKYGCNIPMAILLDPTSSSIFDKTILEALQSPLFMAYHDRQPFNKNHLRVCPLLDDPDAIVGMVETTGARSTDLQDPENVCDLADKCRDKANAWEVAANKLWACL